MILYLTHKEINRQKWDQCIKEASNGLVYALSWYLDVVSPKWDALVEDDYKSVMPLTQNKKYGIEYLHQPHFTQQLGVFSDNPITPALMQNYLSIVAERYRFIEINCNTANRFLSRDFKTSAYITFHLNLNKDYKTLSKNYSQNIIRNIAKAHKSGVALDSNTEAGEIVKLFKKHKGKDYQLKPKQYEMLLKIVKEAEKRNSAIVVGARTGEGALCAGAVFIIGLKKIIFLFSAVSPEGRKSGAMSLIIDHMIKSTAQQGFVLDFEGSMDKNLARFYSSFGSKEAVYLRIKRNMLPKFVRWIKK